MYSTKSSIGLLALVMALCVSSGNAVPQQNQNQVQPAPYGQQAPPDQTVAPGQPGSVNYVEGKASIDNRPIDAKSVGFAYLLAGQTVTTDEGKVELLLIPGVFLRVGDHSTVKMVSPGLSDTRLAITKGEATIEVAEIRKENNLRVDENGVSTRILKTGLYDFDADQGAVRVFKGEARIRNPNQKEVTIKGNHQVTLKTAPLKSVSFDSKEYDMSDLYRWSSLRSAYEAEANVNAASTYAGGGAFDPGWSWDPWFDCYTFLPGDGIFNSPFGWGFYSPWLVGDAPFYYYGGFGGYYGGNYYRHFDRNFHNWGPGPHYGPHAVYGAGHTYQGFGGGVRGGGFAGGGFRGGGGAGGGFHGGGGGGFHGGGGSHGGGGGGGRGR